MFAFVFICKLFGVLAVETLLPLFNMAESWPCFLRWETLADCFGTGAPVLRAQLSDAYATFSNRASTGFKFCKFGHQCF